jgi:hypothetical protein
VNDNKLKIIKEFREEYHSAVVFFVNYLMTNKIESIHKDGSISIFEISSGNLSCPKYISTVGISINSKLSARALKNASSQACSIVRAQIFSYLRAKNKIEWKS